MIPLTVRMRGMRLSRVDAAGTGGEREGLQEGEVSTAKEDAVRGG